MLSNEGYVRNQKLATVSSVLHRYNVVLRRIAEYLSRCRFRIRKSTVYAILPYLPIFCSSEASLSEIKDELSPYLKARKNARHSSRYGGIPVWEDNVEEEVQSGLTSMSGLNRYSYCVAL